MAKVIYKPEPGTPDRHTQFGVEFGPEPVEVTDRAVLAKVRGNPFYDVIEDGEAETGDASEPQIKAVHRGRGVYAVVDGTAVIGQVPTMTKDDADAFNGMSDEDKAAFVDAPPAPTET